MATHWLAEWLSSLELEVDVPFPEGVEPSGGVEALLRYAWDCSRESGRTFSTLHKSSTAEITVRHGWKPALPVFSVEWEQRVEGATRDAFLDALFFNHAATPRHRPTAPTRDGQMTHTSRPNDPRCEKRRFCFWAEFLSRCSLRPSTSRERVPLRGFMPAKPGDFQAREDFF